jgi:outer membrane protein OmpA-like peptidoglycan-associated protein/opacity protein-like surface antigen
MKLRLIALAGLAASAMPLAAQTAGQTTYGKHEINLFGGGSFFKRQDPRPYFDLGKGGVGGFRLTQNFWNYVGIEEAVTVHGTNNATFTLPNSFDTISFGARQRQIYVGPVFHFTPRESRVRPFVTAGPGVNWYIPTDTARNQALRPDGSGLGLARNLKTETVVGFNYGAGIKAKLAERVGLRGDVRGFITQHADFGIPSANPLPNNLVAFQENNPLNALQVTGGLTFYLGKLTEEPIGDFRAGTIEASATAVCPGDQLTLRLPVTNTINGMAAKYKWTVDGQDMGTADSISMRAPDGPKTLNIRAVVDADQSGIKEKNVLRFLRKNPIAASGRDITVQVKEYKAPGVSATANPTQIGPNATSTLTATPTLSECSGDVTYAWEVDGGSLSGTGASRTFSPAGLNLACGTTRTVNAKVTITDAKGGTATASVPVTVAAAPCPPPAPKAPELRPTQFDDIIFTSGGGRVNNCGKRTLDRVYEQAMASGDYDILLVGHIDSSESRIRRRRGADPLDLERVKNAAAYLISGDQPCKRFDRNRVKIATMADNQSSPLRTALCEDSVRERAGSKVRANDDKAKFRRVEVWLVPRDGKGPMPTGITGIQPAPDIAGCPK